MFSFAHVGAELSQIVCDDADGDGSPCYLQSVNQPLGCGGRGACPYHRSRRSRHSTPGPLRDHSLLRITVDVAFDALVHMDAHAGAMLQFVDTQDREARLTYMFRMMQRAFLSMDRVQLEAALLAYNAEAVALKEAAKEVVGWDRLALLLRTVLPFVVAPHMVVTADHVRVIFGSRVSDDALECCVYALNFLLLTRNVTWLWCVPGGRLWLQRVCADEAVEFGMRASCAWLSMHDVADTLTAFEKAHHHHLKQSRRRRSVHQNSDRLVHELNARVKSHGVGHVR